MTIETGHFRGTGAAVNVSLGYIPEFVIVNNFTDGTVVNLGWPRYLPMAYTSESVELKAGMVIGGDTSLARSTILQVLRDTGTVAAGDAAGWLILDALTTTGTWEAEDGFIIHDGWAISDNDFTAAAVGTLGVDIDTEVAADTGITAYKGTTTAAQGFTVASGAATDAKLFSYTAFRND